MKFDYSKIEEVSVADIDISDCPDFTNAFIESAKYEDREMTDQELDELSADSEFMYGAVRKKLYGG